MGYLIALKLVKVSLIALALFVLCTPVFVMFVTRSPGAFLYSIGLTVVGVLVCNILIQLIEAAIVRVEYPNGSRLRSM